MIFGSNIFAVGLGEKRYLIDACQIAQDQFLSNVEAFVKEQNCYFEGILVTHAHFDHMGGAYDVVELMGELGKPIPKIYKKIDGSFTELKRLKEVEQLKDHLHHIDEKSCFELVEKIGQSQTQECKITIKPIETPGHTSDHLSFLYSEEI